MNIKSKAIILIICFCVFSIFHSLNAFNDMKYEIYERVMTRIDRHLKNAVGAEKTLLSKPINIPYLKSLKGNENIDDARLFFVNPQKPHESTHALAFAICAADRERVEHFLKFVTDPNDRSWIVCGFRQDFNMAHVALDPAFPTILHEDTRGLIESRLAVMKLIAAAGFDFNFLGDDTYRNPPLTAGLVSRQPVEGYQQRQALALLLGADPDVIGSSFDAIMSKETALHHCIKLAYVMYTQAEVQNPKLSKYVKEAFKELASRVDGL